MLFLIFSLLNFSFFIYLYILILYSGFEKQIKKFCYWSYWESCVYWGILTVANTLKLSFEFPLSGARFWTNSKKDSHQQNRWSVSLRSAYSCWCDNKSWFGNGVRLCRNLRPKHQGIQRDLGTGQAVYDLVFLSQL